MNEMLWEYRKRMANLGLGSISELSVNDKTMSRRRGGRDYTDKSMVKSMEMSRRGRRDI